MVSTRTIQHYVWIHKKPGNGFFVLRAQKWTMSKFFICEKGRPQEHFLKKILYEEIV
jgi:hypothetical protein